MTMNFARRTCGIQRRILSTFWVAKKSARTRKPNAGSREPEACITMQNDDLASQTPRSSIPPLSDCRPARFRGAIGRARNCRHYAPPANHTLDLDFTAAGIPQRISGIQAARSSRSPLHLVRYLPVATYVAG